MFDLNFTITNLTCEACVKVSSMTIRKLPGVTNVTVDIANGATHIQSDEPIHSSDVEQLLKEKGYNVTF